MTDLNRYLDLGNMIIIPYITKTNIDRINRSILPLEILALEIRLYIYLNIHVDCTGQEIQIECCVECVSMRAELLIKPRLACGTAAACAYAEWVHRW